MRHFRIEKERIRQRDSLTGDLDPDKRFIMHSWMKVIRSIGSGYGGNALLGKKCHALRIASYQALEEKWLAEHMLIVGENPQGEIFNIVGISIGMRKNKSCHVDSPDEYKIWKVRTIGDDIAWLHGRC